MPRIPEHPFNENAPVTHQDTQDLALARPPEELHQRTWTALSGGDPVCEVGDLDLIRRELSALPVNTNARRLELASLRDPDLKTFAKHEDRAVAWCIADLIILAAHSRPDLANLYETLDPAGIVGPFVVNISLSLGEMAHAVQEFSKADDPARLTVVGELLFRWLMPLLHGIAQEIRPTLRGLACNNRGTTIAVGALFRRISFWQRTSGVSGYERQLDLLRTWLDTERIALAQAMQTASSIREIMRSADHLDIWVVAILALCEELHLLSPAAGRRAHQEAETAYYKRFISALDLPTGDLGHGATTYRPFEFEPLLRAMTIVDIESSRFRATFDGLATDGFWNLALPSLRETDRRRAIPFVAVSGIVAARRHDADLLEEVRQCARLLSGSRSAGPQLTSGEIVRQAKAEAGIDLPVI